MGLNHVADVPAAAGITDQILAPDANNLTLVRLVLASCVIWTHCYWAVTGVEGQDQFVAWLGKPLSFLAVNGFFFLSGFLICRSALLGNNLGSFIIMRLARIWPGLCVCLLATVVAFALLGGGSSGFGTVLQSPATWRFLARNLALVGGAYALPMPGGDGQLVNVNGSLWTIAWEIRCYMGMALLFMVPQRWRPMVATIGFLAVLGACAAWAAHDMATNRLGIKPAGLWFYVDTGLRLAGCFVLGCLAYRFRQHVRLSMVGMVAAWAVALVAYAVSDFWPAASWALCYSILCVAFCPWPGAGRLRALPDYSYGIYIYAFPVMVLLHLWQPGMGHAMLASANLLGTVILAGLSWHMVEKPALTLARRHFGRAR
ncbi:MAG: acyltransferase family protein [Sphingopyxis sp.]